MTQTTRTDAWTLDPQKLVRARMEAGLTQRALAEAAQISPQHMNDIESGRRHGSPAVRRRIAQALDLLLVDLVRGDA